MKLEQPYPAEQLTLELVGRESLVWQGDDCKHVTVTETDLVISNQFFNSRIKLAY